ncbi:hypothetical protein ACN28S_60585 [Cystobacter fuscus]
MKPRFTLFCLLAAVVSLGGTGCATASRATAAPVTPAPEPIAEPAPAPEPPLAPEPVVKADRPKASKRAARPAPEAKAAARTPVVARSPEPRRPQTDGMSLESGEPVAFEPSVMTRPQRVSGRQPQLTPEAQAEHVRGTALVRCVVTREGEVKNCRLLNGLPYMNQELLEALSTGASPPPPPRASRSTWTTPSSSASPWGERALRG